MAVLTIQLTGATGYEGEWISQSTRQENMANYTLQPTHNISPPKNKGENGRATHPSHA